MVELLVSGLVDPKSAFRKALRQRLKSIGSKAGPINKYQSASGKWYILFTVEYNDFMYKCLIYDDTNIIVDNGTRMTVPAKLLFTVASCTNSYAFSLHREIEETDES